jgi:hypothetical protein
MSGGESSFEKYDRRQRRQEATPEIGERLGQLHDAILDDPPRRIHLGLHRLIHLHASR